VNRFKNNRVRWFLLVVALVSFHLSILSFSSASSKSNPAIILSLEEAVTIALGKNRNIVRSINDEESAKLTLGSSLSDFDIKLKPASVIGITEDNKKIDAGVTVSKKFYNGVEVSSTPYMGISDDGYNSRLAVSLNIPIMKSYGTLVNQEFIKSSEFGVRNARRSSLQTQEDIFLNTVTAYYNILEFMKNVDLNTFLVKKFENYSIIAKTKTAVGLADPLDVYRSEIQLQNVQVSLSSSVERFQNAQNNFKSLLAIPQNKTVLIKDTHLNISKVNFSLQKAETIAFENSIDIKKSKDSLSERKRASRIAKKNIQPDLNLSLVYTMAGDSEYFNQGLLDIDGDTFGIFLVSSGDFERKVEKKNYLQSKLNIRSAQLDFENTKDQLSKNVKNQLDTLTEVWDRIGFIEKKIRDATGKLKLAAVKFDNGLSGNFDMIEAETELNQARLDHLRAKITYIVGNYRLRKILGTLIQYE